jgi:GNAT superfamily N-acetyltransferase
VVAPDGGAVVGTARVVGDGVTYVAVQDVAVHPEHQARGIGRALLDRVLERIAAGAPATAFVSGVRDPGGRRARPGGGVHDRDMDRTTRLVEPRR